MIDATMQPATPQQRLDAAHDRFAQVNRTLPGGIRGFQVPAEAHLAASLDALARILLARGLIDEQEFIDAKTLRLAEIIDGMCDQAVAAKRAATSLVLPRTPRPA